MGKRKSGLQGHLRRDRGRAFKEAQEADSPVDRLRAVAKAEAAELAALSLVPLGRVTVAARERVSGDLAERYDEIVGIARVAGEVALRPEDDPNQLAYWADMRLTSDPIA